MNVCESCDALIYLAVTATGAILPVDAVPTEDGKIRLRYKEDGKLPEAHVLDLGERVSLARQLECRGGKLELFTAHFCSEPTDDVQGGES